MDMSLSKNVTDNFLDWLNSCPNRWVLLESDDNSISYEFIFEDIRYCEKQSDHGRNCGGQIVDGECTICF